MAEPTLHLIKLFVGRSRLSELQDFQRGREGQVHPHTGLVEHAHVTRHMPKRAEELLQGGSLYWVMSGFVVARQKLIEFRPLAVDGKPHCVIVYDREVIPVVPRPRRPFQGWRYFDAKDAPPDMTGEADPGEMPEELQHELSRLGLL